GTQGDLRFLDFDFPAACGAWLPHQVLPVKPVSEGCFLAGERQFDLLTGLNLLGDFFEDPVSPLITALAGFLGAQVAGDFLGEIGLAFAHSTSASSSATRARLRRLSGVKGKLARKRSNISLNWEIKIGRAHV